MVGRCERLRFVLKLWPCYLTSCLAFTYVLYFKYAPTRPVLIGRGCVWWSLSLHKGDLNIVTPCFAPVTPWGDILISVGAVWLFWNPISAAQNKNVQCLCGFLPVEKKNSATIYSQSNFYLNTDARLIFSRNEWHLHKLCYFKELNIKTASVLSYRYLLTIHTIKSLGKTAFGFSEAFSFKRV